jgi:hypothetical protein
MDQKQIVKERLNYHFKNADGSWNIPEGMPFMKEFLNEVEKLASDGDWVVVSDRLPEPEQMIWFYHKDGYINRDIYLMADEVYFTHWMPYESIKPPFR